MSTESTTTTLGPGEWWQATAEGRLLLLRCPVCTDTWLPWSPHCPNCGPGTDPVALESAGRGSLYSWVVIHYSLSAPDDVPFTVGSVRLEEGAMVYGRLTPEAAKVVRADAPLTAVFAERDGRSVVDFAPVVT